MDFKLSLNLMPSLAGTLVADMACRAMKRDDRLFLEHLLSDLSPEARAEPWWQIVQAHCYRLAGNNQASRAVAEAFLNHPDPAVRGTAWAFFAVATQPITLPDVREAALRALEILPPEMAWSRGVAWNALGIHWLEQSDYRQAAHAFAAALVAFRQADAPVRVARVTGAMACVLTNQGRSRAAVSLLRRAIRISRDYACPPIPFHYVQLALAHHDLGELPEAMSTLQFGLDVAPSWGGRVAMVQLWLLLSRFQLCQGHPDEAGRSLDRVETLIADLDRHAVLQWYCLQRAEWARQSGDLAACSDHLERARVWRRDGGWDIDIELQQVRLLLDQRVYDQARECLVRAETAAHRRGDRCLSAKVQAYVAYVSALMGDTTAASAASARCDQLCRQEGYSRAVLEAELLANRQDELPAHDVFVRCFGEFDAHWAEGEDVFGGMQGDKPRRLLARLLLAPQGVSRKDLVRAIYGGQTVHPNTLHMLIVRMRERFSGRQGPWESAGIIVWQKQRYHLNDACRIRTELSEFHTAYGEWLQGGSQKRSAAERVIALYRGPLFGSLTNLAWVKPEAERVKRLWHQVVLWQLDELQARQDIEAVLSLLEASLSLDPLSEPLNYRYIEALLSLGRRTEAQYHFQQIMDRFFRDGRTVSQSFRQLRDGL